MDDSKQKPDDMPVNDRLEEVVRDAVTYQGNTVSYVKDVGTSDPGYDANVRQVVIGHPDGKTEVVPESEIMRVAKPAAAEGRELDRPDSPPKPLIENPRVQ